MTEQARLLIVDDLEQNLVALEALLEDCGAEIKRATSGNEALASLLKYDFALVLLDVQMPGMDGFETAELMRLNPRTRHVPIIFVTAISNKQHYVFKGYEAGAVDYMAKPIDPVILRSKVAVFLELWRARKELTTALEQTEKLSEQLRLQAQYDSLTGLPNRSLFEDRLTQAALLSDRNSDPGALMFIDLDRFKSVNDSLGHDAGDDLLVQVAERLQGCVRKSDTVARLGGDEFTVILQSLTDADQAGRIAAQIIEVLAQPFDLAGRQVKVSGSVGITIFPQDASDIRQLLVNADTAMYEAKRAGRNAYRFFASESSAEHGNGHDGPARTSTS